MTDEEHLERIREWSKGLSGEVKYNVEELLDYIDNTKLPIGNEPREREIENLLDVMDDLLVEIEKYKRERDSLSGRIVDMASIAFKDNRFGKRKKALEDIFTHSFEGR